MNRYLEALAELHDYCHYMDVGCDHPDNEDCPVCRAWKLISEAQTTEEKTDD